MCFNLKGTYETLIILGKRKLTKFCKVLQSNKNVHKNFSTSNSAMNKFSNFLNNLILVNSCNKNTFLQTNVSRIFP